MLDFVALLAEFFGTFLLIMSILATGNALAVGATLALVIFLIGSLSGGHVNPAVSLAMFVNGSMTVAELLGYFAVQLLGGALAVFVYKALA